MTAGNMEKLSSPGRGSGRRPPPPIFSPPPHMFGRLSHRGGGGRRPVAEGQGQAQGKGQDAEGKRPQGGAPRTLPRGKGPPSPTCSGDGADAQPSSGPAKGTFGRRGRGGGHFLSTVPLKAKAAGARASPTSRRTDARSASSSTRANAMAAAGTFTRAWCATAATRSPSAPAARSLRPRPRGRDSPRRPVGARPPLLRALRRVAP